MPIRRIPCCLNLLDFPVEAARQKEPEAPAQFLEQSYQVGMAYTVTAFIFFLGDFFTPPQKKQGDRKDE